MKKFLTIALLIVPFSFIVAQVKVVQPTVETLSNPLGLDIKNPRFSWVIESNQRNVMQSAYELRISDNPAFKTSVKNGWNSGRVNSSQSVFVPYKGPALQSGKRYYWQVRIWDEKGRVSPWSTPAYWEMGLLSIADWKASWIQPGYLEDSVMRPSPVFRKEFKTSKKISSARAYITSHGMYEAYINGKRVGDAYFTPGWTSYNKRLQYQVYDVTPLLTAGDNAIGVMLGSGWYRGILAWENNKNIYGRDLALLMQMELSYTDGSKEIIVTDDTWKSSTGPILYSEIYHGETFDARKADKDWSTTRFNDESWSGVIVKDHTKNTLIATYNEAVKKHEIFEPLKVITTPKGEKVIDFGQNLVGWVRIKAKGKAGDSIRISHAEVLDKDGNFYTANLRAARQQNIYILKGDGEETFEPHFTFQGFRYIRVDGVPGNLDPNAFTAYAMYSAMQPTGSFTSSHPLINQLQKNIQWGQKGNFVDVPTDCPQRDERLGWTGDAQVFSRTAAYNMQVRNFFSKWLKDVAADQTEEGAVPFVVPNVLGKGAVASTGWADAAIIIPWDMYNVYGDTNILREQYASMKSWVGYMQNKSKNDLWNQGFHFGDWLFFKPADDLDGRAAVTDKYLISQCFFANSSNLLSKISTILGETADARRYEDLTKKLKDAFLKEYVTPNGRLISGTQTAYTLALNFDMLPEEMRNQAAQRLADNVRSYDNHLTTGFLGTPYLCHVLSRFGYTDLAYKLLLQETYPSWLYPVKMGATTIWERWDGQKPDSTFQNIGMNSFNHYAYGAIGDWMYRVAAGIETDVTAPGYKKIIIKPNPGGSFSDMHASYTSSYGTVSSKWKMEGKSFILDVQIPPNTTATIYIPSAGNMSVREGNKELEEAGLKAVDGGKGFLKVEVGSGKYSFSSSLP